MCVGKRNETNWQINLKLGIPQNLSIRSILIRLTSPAHQATRSTSLSTNCWFTMHGKIQPGLRGVKSPFAMNSCQYCTDLQPIHYNKPSVKSEFSQFHSDWFIVFLSTRHGSVLHTHNLQVNNVIPMPLQCHSNVICHGQKMMLPGCTSSFLVSVLSGRPPSPLKCWSCISEVHEVDPDLAKSVADTFWRDLVVYGCVMSCSKCQIPTI
jgi:hypothetical protein